MFGDENSLRKYVSYNSSPSSFSTKIFNYLSISSSEAEAIRDHFRNKLMLYTASEKEGTEKVRTVISTLGKSTIHYVKEAT
jgi:UTP-glucose-1-phosphate uridylyltransferase